MPELETVERKSEAELEAERRAKEEEEEAKRQQEEEEAKRQQEEEEEAKRKAAERGYIRSKMTGTIAELCLVDRKKPLAPTAAAANAKKAGYYITIPQFT